MDYVIPLFMLLAVASPMMKKYLICLTHKKEIEMKKINTTYLTFCKMFQYHCIKGLDDFLVLHFCYSVETWFLVRLHDIRLYLHLLITIICVSI